MYNFRHNVSSDFPSALSGLSLKGHRVSCSEISTWIALMFFTRRTIKAAVKYLHDAQRPEGGWFGSWGICFTYATQFALESLALVGETYATSERVRKACRFLLSSDASITSSGKRPDDVRSAKTFSVVNAWANSPDGGGATMRGIFAVE